MPSPTLVLLAASWLATLLAGSGTAPVFTTPDHAVLAPGVAGTVTIATEGSPTPSLEVSQGNLPDGVWFRDNGDGTASLGGTPSAVGSVDLTIRASNAVGLSTQSLRLVLGSPPTLEGPTVASFTRDRPSSVTVRFAGLPVPVISLAWGALPRGLTLTDDGDGSATLSGTPTGRPGRAVVGLLAGNDAGHGAVRLRVRVRPMLGACANAFPGTAGADRLHGSPAGDRLTGLSGDDQLFGSWGADCLLGGRGRDGLWGDPGADVLLGGDGGDVLRGGRGDDRLRGGAGDDRLIASYGDDLLVGGPGHDVLRGGPGDDSIRAADGLRDLVLCGRGYDAVVADRRDRLVGCESVRWGSIAR
jgi:Ca2+-binding RTX toxin-like protein